MQTKTVNTKKKKVTLAKEAFELKPLKRQINDGHQAVEAFKKSVKDKSRQALTEAIIVGQKLKRVKEIVGHGGFLRWVRENCKDIGERTARKYMALSNRNHGAELTATGLRKAYIELGIIDEGETTTRVEEHAEANNRSAQPTKATPTTPAARAAAVVTSKTAKPAINEADALSRPSYLVNELLSTLNKLYQSKTATLDVLRNAALKPVQCWFDEQK